MRKPSLFGWRWRCLCVLLALTGSAGDAPASSLPPGFTELNIARPDERPWQDAAGIAFARDGRMFVWERAGRVWSVGAATKSVQPLIDLSDEVDTSGTLGLAGFALDPEFEQNGYVYLFYALAPQYLAQHATSGPTTARLVRYQLNENGLNQASRRVLLGETLPDGSVASSCVVTDAGQGPGGLAFGNDGTLLAACGDGAGSRSLDGGSDPSTQYKEALAAGLMKPSENVGAFRAQMVDSLSGKILRLDAATGEGVPSNPFYDADRAALRALAHLAPGLA